MRQHQNMVLVDNYIVMKPGPLNLPTIWRGCVYPPIRIAWSDGNGNPIDLTGLTPRANSRDFKFTVRVTSALNGVTHLSLPIQLTRNLKLGVTNWDFLWVESDIPNTGLPGITKPLLRGNVEVKEPVAKPPLNVSGKIGGGSNYMKVVPTYVVDGNNNFCLIGNYNQVLTDPNGRQWDIRSIVHQQLHTMYDNGQRQISLVLWFISPPREDQIPDAEAHHYVNDSGLGLALQPEADSYDGNGDPNGGHLWPQHEQNLIDILQLLSDIGYEQVKIGYAPLGNMRTDEWGGVWQPRYYGIVRNFMMSVTRVVNAHQHNMEIIFDLGGEYVNESMRPPDPNEPYPPPPGPTNAERVVHRQYARLLWGSFTDEFRPGSSTSFGVLAGAGTVTYRRFNYWLQLIKDFNLPYPGYYRTEGYGDPIIIYDALTGMYHALKDHIPAQDHKPIIIGETYYNNLEVASQIENASADYPQMKLAGFRQWPRVFGQPINEFPDIYPKQFDAYQTL